MDPNGLRMIKTIFMKHIIKAVVDKGIKGIRERRSMKHGTAQWRVIMIGDMADQEAASKFFDANTDEGWFVSLQRTVL